MSEKFTVIERNSENKANRSPFSVKRVLGIAATAALAMGTVSGCSNEENINAIPESAPQSEIAEVVETPESEIEEAPQSEEEDDIEGEEYEPFVSDAIINYELIDGWDELSEQERVFQAAKFFGDNDIHPIGYIELDGLKETQSFGQAVVDNFMARYMLVHGVMRDLTDPRNQDFALKMSEAGLFDERLGYEEDFKTYENFMNFMSAVGQYSNEDNMPVQYTIGNVDSYSDKYVAGNGWEAMRINSMGLSNWSLASDPPETYFQSMWYLPVVPYDGDGALGTFPMLVGIAERLDRIELPFNYKSMTGDEVSVTIVGE